jgi:hypothetical protein
LYAFKVVVAVAGAQQELLVAAAAQWLRKLCASRLLAGRMWSALAVLFPRRVLLPHLDHSGQTVARLHLLATFRVLAALSAWQRGQLARLQRQFPLEVLDVE